MFRVKICGVSTVDDALTAARAGADAVGLNFYAKSPRCIPPDRARRIVEALPAEIAKVGVFVNASASEIGRVVEEVGLNVVQLHGDEPPDFLAQLGGVPVVRAFRLGDGGLDAIDHYLQRCRQIDGMPCLTLIDSFAKGVYGGTGAAANWAVVGEYPRRDWHPPLVLAGGLKPGNVAEAIRAARPAAVDTASGVESSPGRKDERLVRQFVRAAWEAFQNAT
ncbi:MAG: phosphoribosylanthranilate isomerase [Planctomycetota bacterium]|jgi:phosphoribosylanthranilate isomerase